MKQRGRFGLYVGSISAALSHAVFAPSREGFGGRGGGGGARAHIPEQRLTIEPSLYATRP